MNVVVMRRPKQPRQKKKKKKKKKKRIGVLGFEVSTRFARQMSSKHPFHFPRLRVSVVAEYASPNHQVEYPTYR